jgi:hypothetical protein
MTGLSAVDAGQDTRRLASRCAPDRLAANGHQSLIDDLNKIYIDLTA